MNEVVMISEKVSSRIILLRHAAGGDPSILHRGKAGVRPVLDEEHERQQAAVLGGDVLREGAVVAADVGQRAHQPVVRRVAHRVAALGVHRDARNGLDRALRLPRAP